MTRKRGAPRTPMRLYGDGDGRRAAVKDGGGRVRERERERERKERVIHTRVPERLEAQLRKRAEDLGISVSNLVRNVLGHAFGVVGGVVADGHASHAVARAVRGDAARAYPGTAGAPAPAPAAVPSPSAPSPSAPAPGAPEAAPAAATPAPAARPPAADVLGWQPIVLGRNAVCARCSAIVPRGSDGALGAGTQIIVCLACLDELRR